MLGSKRSRLARFVDSAIVVLKSGLTTRAQLREVAQTLERLEVSAVGLVLNRVSSSEKKHGSSRRPVRIAEQRPRGKVRIHARPWSRPRPLAQAGREPAQELSAVSKPDSVERTVAAQPACSSPQPGDVFQPVSNAAPGLETESTADAAPARTARGRGEPNRTAPAAKGSRTVATATNSAGSAGGPSVLSETVAAAPVPGTRRSTTASASSAPPAVEGSQAEAPVSPVPGARTAAGRASTAVPELQSEAVPEDLSLEKDEEEHAPPSRLSGLRNMLIALGRRSLGQEAPRAKHAPDFEPRFERATVRPAYSEPPAAAGNQHAATGAVPVELTARPEFLPPKVVAEAEKEKEPLRPTAPPPRRDKVEGQDEIQTLPSWRGQYRKKRYPPI